MQTISDFNSSIQFENRSASINYIISPKATNDMKFDQNMSTTILSKRPKIAGSPP